jgi:hypothetical protein
VSDGFVVRASDLQVGSWTLLQYLAVFSAALAAARSMAGEDDAEHIPLSEV